jgi:hypothetical protein
MTDEAAVVEAAAVAIWNVACNRSGRARRPWDEVPEALRHAHRLEARAALVAVGLIDASIDQRLGPAGYGE